MTAIWEPNNAEEHYIALSAPLLALLRAVCFLDQVDEHVQPALRVAVRLAHIDKTSGGVVFGVRIRMDE
jgi:hypothetical protein